LSAAGFITPFRGTPIFGSFLPPHPRADFLGGAIPLGVEILDFREDFPPLLVELGQFVNLGVIPRSARGKASARKIRLVTNQFDAEHRQIIGAKPTTARRKAELASDQLARGAGRRGKDFQKCEWRINALPVARNGQNNSGFAV
jgi:hypothetical protein